MTEAAPIVGADPLWTLSDVSEYLREAERTTRRRIEQGQLSPVRLPGSRRLLFRPADVVAFVDGAA